MQRRTIQKEVYMIITTAREEKKRKTMSACRRFACAGSMSITLDNISNQQKTNKNNKIGIVAVLRCHILLLIYIRACVCVFCSISLFKLNRGRERFSRPLTPGVDVGS